MCDNLNFICGILCENHEKKKIMCPNCALPEHLFLEPLHVSACLTEGTRNVTSLVKVTHLWISQGSQQEQVIELIYWGKEIYQSDLQTV